MEIKKLYENYLKEIELFYAEKISEVLLNTNEKYTVCSEMADLSSYILDTFNEIKFEKTDISLPLKFLFTGNKILYNENNLNYKQNEFNTYIHSQLAFILSGRWLKNNNKQSQADKNIPLVWLGRFNFEQVSISYPTQSLNKLFERRANLNIKYWFATVNEKQIIFNELINSNIKFIIQKDNIYYIPAINLCTNEYYIGNAIYKYKFTQNNTLRILNPHISYKYIKINELI